jgi:hypothetical protein
LALQRWVSRLFIPISSSFVGIGLRFGYGYRIKDIREIRRSYRKICLEHDGPMMICANHLTKIDSFVIAWALASPWSYTLHPETLPWNIPEKSIFGSTLPKRIAIYILKCLPIERGGSRAGTAEVLNRMSYTLSLGEKVLVFAEGRRSRSGRVEVESAAAGVGRVYRSLPGCRVLCLYLRGEQQESYSDTPIRGERFYVSLNLFEPKTDHRGLRGSLDVAQQIAGRLAEMEHEYFDHRK